MIDLSEEAAALEAALGPAFGAGGGRVVQFVSAQRGEGTSTVAREFARHLAQRARKGVWLIELDLMRGDQYGALASDPERYGFLGKAVKSSADGSMFFQVVPALKGVDGRPWSDASYMAAYPVGGKRWWVTRFRRETLKAGQTARILNAPGYWQSLRQHADWVIVDSPAAERSRVVLASAPHMDANVLVVAAEQGEPERPAMLRDAITSVGGNVAGVFLNRVRTEAAPFMKRRLPG
jgi:Mrp family chromosome partitioning ATPase